VLFVVGGFAAILAGIALKRRFAFNPWLRGAHLAAIAFVVGESVLGYMCPLTLWEDALRGNHGGPGFIQRWIHAWLFYDVPASFFTPVYLAFLLAVIWSWVRHPPRRRYGG
jgi:polyferredoxin